ncbi:MAG: hypothetical protein JO352_12380 [Chloroflexi bacterium]|nr:hypothetical protein [Chloroflexota bacterium]
MSDWEQLAARPGGTVAALATATTADGQTLVFAATSAGVYRSSDRGQTWTATSPNDVVPFNEAILASPGFATDRTLFVGGRNGLYRSLDGASTWSRVLTGGHVTSLAVAPEVIFAGTEVDGILRSEDGGRTWSSANPGLLDLTVLALALSPAFERDGTGLAATASGVYRTRNAGKSWREIDLGLEVAVQCLALSPTFAEDRLALAGTEADGLLRSDDGGARWEPVAGLDGHSITAIAFSSRYPGRPTLAVATDAGIAISEDAGRAWRMIAADVGAVLTLTFVPGASHGVDVAHDEVLLAGLHRDGVARLAVDGQGWTLANDGLQARLLLGVALSPTFEADRTLFAAGPDDGVLVSRDAGRSWSASLVGPDDPQVFGVAASPSYARDRTVFAATAAGILRSRDGGAGWHTVATQAEAAAGARAVIAAPPAADGAPTLLAAVENGRLVASTDLGDSWRSFGDIFAGEQVISLAFSPDYADDHVLCVGTTGSRPGEPGEVTLWRSADSGLSWRRWLVERGGALLPVAIPGGHALSELVFVGLGGQVLKPVRHTRETRRGEQRPMWRGVQVGKPATVITALAATSDASRRMVVFAATSAGVYVSRDGGDTFTAWGGARGPGPIVALSVSPNYARDNLVYALGLGGAIWRRQDA